MMIMKDEMKLVAENWNEIYLLRFFVQMKAENEKEYQL